MANSPTTTRDPFSIQLADRFAIAAGLPLLAGQAVEALFPRARFEREGERFQIFRQDDWLIGAATESAASGLEAITQTIYEELLRETAGVNLARIWNYVPRINETDTGGLENYRAFCRGRSFAFEAAWGAAYRPRVPAASAVGSQNGSLSVIFAASERRARHLENPRQVPAYDYPSAYGPRSPTFARATVVPDGNRSGEAIFISGTAAIRGHATIAPHDTMQQLTCTLENLDEVARACGLDALTSSRSESRAAKSGVRHIKIYLRNPDDLAHVAEVLDTSFLRPDDSVSYLHADICRADLNVEIEMSVLPREIPNR